MKSTALKKISITLVVLLSLIIATILLLPVVLHTDKVRHFIIKQIEQTTGGQVALHSLSWDIGNELRLKAKGFSIDGATLFPADLQLSGLEIRLELLPLLFRQVIISDLNIQKPGVNLQLSKKAEPDEKTASSLVTDNLSFPVEITIEKFNLTQGQLIIEDTLTVPEQKINSTFADVNIAASDITPGQDIGFQFSLNTRISAGTGNSTVAGKTTSEGKIVGQGKFSGLNQALAIQNPHLKLSVSGNEIHASLLKPYLQDDLLADKMDGSISIDLDYQGHLDENFSLDGSVDLSHFSYTDPSLWENALPGPSASIEYQIKASPDKLEINTLNIKLGEVSLAAHTVVQDWLVDPLIKDALLGGTFPLASLESLIPWALLGDKEDEIRKIIHRQGEIKLERITLSEASLASIATNPQSVLSIIEGSGNVSGIAVTPPLELPDIKDISGSIILYEGTLNVSGLQGYIGPLTLPPMNIQATDLAATMQISASAKGPVKLEAHDNTEISALLKQHGLESLTGKADLDIQFSYDQAKPEPLLLSGAIVFNGVNVKSYPKGVRLDDLQGHITLEQDNKLDISIEKLSGKLQQHPFHLNGSFTSVGSPDMLIDVDVRSKQLEPGLFSTLFPELFSVLQSYELQGKLDMDVNVHYLHAEPVKSSLKGYINFREIGLQIPDNGLTIKNGKANFKLEGNSVRINNTSFRINEQLISASGRLSNPRYPNGWLNLKSPQLNINKILPDPEDKQQKVKPTERSKKAAALPEWLQNLTLRLKTDINAGEFNGQSFKDLRYTGNYKRGLLSDQKLDLDIESGHIKFLANADLRDPEAISFSVEPGLDKVPFQSLSKLISTKLNIDGPLTLSGKMSGKMSGKTGTIQTFMQSLKGQVDMQSGPGQIKEETSVIRPLFTVLSVINLKGLLPGNIGRNFSKKGLAYTSFRFIADISDGMISMDELNLVTPAIIINSTGTLELPEQQLDVEAKVKVFGTLDAVLGLIPLVGKSADKLTDINLEVKGPLDNVKVMVRPLKGVGNALKEVGNEPFKGIKGLFKKQEKQEENNEGKTGK